MLMLWSLATSSLARTVHIFAEVIDNEASHSTSSLNDLNTIKDIEQILDNQKPLAQVKLGSDTYLMRQKCLWGGCKCSSNGAFSCSKRNKDKTDCKTAYHVGECGYV